MNSKKECIAMLLAGGQGSRLGALTKHIAKPAVSFGGKYRMIDFTLSNCANSEIDTVGVLTQYRPYLLNNYIGNGSAWDLDVRDGGVAVLPPYATETGGKWYAGTADAIYQNIDYINMYKPEYVVILSGDHIYRMDYRLMLEFHKKNNADLTIAVMKVPISEASRFGIMSTDKDKRITKFSEKPKQPESDLASLGIYIFTTDVLIKALNEDAKDTSSEHDFGKNIIPKLLGENKRLFAYEFSDFWMDVGTIPAYWEASMDLLSINPKFKLATKGAKIYSNETDEPPQYIGKNAKISESLVGNGVKVLGNVTHSVLSTEAFVDEGVEIVDSVLLPYAKVGKNAKVYRAIIGENAILADNETFGDLKEDGEIMVLGGDK